jgi:hypothetical protein
MMNMEVVNVKSTNFLGVITESNLSLEVILKEPAVELAVTYL